MLVFEPSKIPGIPENIEELPRKTIKEISQRLYKYGVRPNVISETLKVGISSVHRWAKEGEAE